MRACCSATFLHPDKQEEDGEHEEHDDAVLVREPRQRGHVPLGARGALLGVAAARVHVRRVGGGGDGGVAFGDRVRLKWPNDIYAFTQHAGIKKIGGILVNTSFMGGHVDIVVGTSYRIVSRPIFDVLMTSCK